MVQTSLVTQLWSSKCVLESWVTLHQSLAPPPPAAVAEVRFVSCRYKLSLTLPAHQPTTTTPDAESARSRLSGGVGHDSGITHLEFVSRELNQIGGGSGRGGARPGGVAGGRGGSGEVMVHLFIATLTSLQSKCTYGPKQVRSFAAAVVQNSRTHFCPAPVQMLGQSLSTLDWEGAEPGCSTVDHQGGFFVKGQVLYTHHAPRAVAAAAQAHVRLLRRPSPAGSWRVLLLARGPRRLLCLRRHAHPLGLVPILPHRGCPRQVRTHGYCQPPPAPRSSWSHTHLGPATPATHMPAQIWPHIAQHL